LKKTAFWDIARVITLEQTDVSKVLTASIISVIIVILMMEAI
jgi:hypothetical protein